MAETRSELNMDLTKLKMKLSQDGIFYKRVLDFYLSSTRLTFLLKRDTVI